MVTLGMRLLKAFSIIFLIIIRIIAQVLEESLFQLLESPFFFCKKFNCVIAFNN